VRVVLASASPSRLATLRAAGVDAEPIVSGVDESAYDGSDAAALTVALAQAKARAVVAMPAARGADLVIGCDSMLELDGRVVGKPVDAAEAAAHWRAMRGRSGALVTGHCVIAARSRREATGPASTVVHFADLSDEEIAEYVLTEEPLGVAGAFTVDGRGGAFVTAIEGDYHNVVGISLPLLRELVLSLGLSWTGLWR
jgi:nucleoside triphosphate pyrophosphatase